MAVRLRLTIPKDAGLTRRLRQARTLPINRLVGPLALPRYRVDWDGWDSARRSDTALGTDTETINRLTREWYAGAEVELIQTHGVDFDDSATYGGIGQAPVVVGTASRGRFRDSADALGLLGQRLMWTSKGLWMVVAAMEAPIGSNYRSRTLQSAMAMSARSRAYQRDLLNGRLSTDGPGGQELLEALRLLGKAGLWVHGLPPLLLRMASNDYPPIHDNSRTVYDKIVAAHAELAGQRRKRQTREARKWARSAPERIGHRVTKDIEFVTSKSASASKTHQGETTNQRAADCGVAEWGDIWHATDIDVGDEVIRKW